MIDILAGRHDHPRETHLGQLRAERGLRLYVIAQDVERRQQQLAAPHPLVRLRNIDDMRPVDLAVESTLAGHETAAREEVQREQLPHREHDAPPPVLRLAIECHLYSVAYTERQRIMLRSSRATGNRGWGTGRALAGVDAALLDQNP